MTLSKRWIETRKPTNQREITPVQEGIGLYLFQSGHSKRFVGRTRFPSGRKGKVLDVPVGVWAKTSTKWKMQLESGWISNSGQKRLVVIQSSTQTNLPKDNLRNH